MSKVDKNDLIYFKECCDKTYATSKNVETDGLVQQTVNGNNVYPKTKAEAVIMSDGKTLEEFMQSGGGSSFIRANDATVSGITSITSTGTYQFAISLSPSNYNVDIEKVTVTSDCSEITISNISAAGFTMNVNSVPSATDHKLAIGIEDKLGMVITKEVAFTVKVEATDMTITGSDSIENEATSQYTISYTPSNCNIIPTVTVTSNQSSVPVVDANPYMFKISPNCTDSLTASITVTATFPSGKVITKTKSIEVNCGPDYDAIDQYGVGIMTVSGEFYPDSASWINAGKPTANGVAVSNGTHRFCIAKDIINHVCSTSSYPDAEYWGACSKTVSGLTTTTSSTTAKADLNGVTNTDAIVKNVTSTDSYFTKSPWSAAGLCRQFTFPDGSKGYLGACGEWKLVQDSINKINTLMLAIGGDQIDIWTYTYYWSSTQYDSFLAWNWNFSNESYLSNKYDYNRVRAFSAF